MLESSLPHSLMDVLGIPLESLFLGGHCLATARSIWACIAVLTAAVSFWRITAVGSRPHHKSSDANPSFRDQLQPNVESAETEAPQVPRQPDLTPAAELAAFPRDEGGRKGVKFAAYYCEVDDDGARNKEEEDGRNEEDEAVGRACDGVFDGVWGFDAGVGMMIQLPVVMRTGDLGWYRCQDLTVLNGSVVRLWDGGRRRCHR
ncbi:hypothetical protein ACLOJK_025815 [Asimina triloba]